MTAINVGEEHEQMTLNKYSGMSIQNDKTESQQDKRQTVGQQLKHWRNKLGISQMALALQGETSARHLSFIETGRAHPARKLLLKLCEVLEIPLRARNVLLITANYVPLYGETGLSEPEMQQVRKILRLMLDKSDPYPAMLTDHQMNIIMSNKGWKAITTLMVDDPRLLEGENVNLLQLMTDPAGLRSNVVNIEYAYHTLLERARRTLVIDRANERFKQLVNTMEQLKPKTIAPDESLLPQLVMPLHFKKGDIELRLYTTVATLGVPLNVTLQELYIESGYPMDKASDQLLQQLVQSQSGTA